MRRPLLLSLLAIAALLLSGCPPEIQQAQPEAFHVAGDVTLEIEGEHTLSGHFEAEYLLEDRARLGDLWLRQVRFSRLHAWIDDRDVVIERVGRDRVIPLRCTTLAANGPIEGLVQEDGSLSLPGGAAIFGLSYESRSATGGCPGEGSVIAFNGATERAITGRLDPGGDRFEASGRFEVEIEDEEVDGTLAFTGHYVNRPPTAVIASIAPPGAGSPGFDLSQGGCPPLTGRNPDGVDSNSPDGLRLVVQSVSHDPDGGFSRADLTHEEWARYWGRPETPGVRYEFIGRGRRFGPLLFEADQEHTVVLAVFDRHGARNETRCTFYVRPPA